MVFRIIITKTHSMHINFLGNLIKKGCIFILVIMVSPSSFSQKDISSLNTRLEELNKEGVSTELADVYNKIGILYWQEGNLDFAVENFKQSLLINEQIDNENALRIINEYLGMVYLEKEDYNSAIETFNKSLILNKNAGKIQEIISDYYNLALAYQGLGNYTTSNEYAIKAYGKSLEINNIKTTKSCFLVMAENYEKLGNNKLANEYYEKVSAISKQLQKQQMIKLEKEKEQIQTNASRKEAELKTTKSQLEEVKADNKEYQLEKEKRELEILKEHAEAKAKEEMRKTQILYLLVVIALFMFVLILFIFQNRARKKSNQKLQEQNNKIEAQKKEIENQRDLANKQRKNLTDSIQYARRIQSAVIPREESLLEQFNDSFIFYRPRDIVSGDFYWFVQKESTVIIAAADCTGHGVPGAFMSMLGVAYLNEIVNKIATNIHINSLNADEILNELRERVIFSLRQSENERDPKDGMDIALCIVDFQKNKLQYAGAYNPLLIIRDGELIKLKADKMPVSYHRKKDQPFTRHNFELKDGDCLYMFTDGFIDQFGGKEGRKYLLKNFIKLLLDIHMEPMWKQKERLISSFDNWKDDNNQIDDVLVIGLKYSNISKTSAISWASKTILIAEDTDINYFLIHEVLKKTNAKLVRVTNGVEAVDFVKSNHVDLILMDINMPKMNGHQATKLIKEFNSTIPVIMQTAISEDHRKEAFDAGADDYISKPIDLKPFMAKISRYLL